MKVRTITAVALATVVGYAVGSCSPIPNSGGASLGSPTEAHLPVLVGLELAQAFATTYEPIVDLGEGVQIDSSRYPDGAAFRFERMGVEVGSPKVGGTVCGRVIAIGAAQVVGPEACANLSSDGKGWVRLVVPFVPVSGDDRYVLQVRRGTGAAAFNNFPAEVLVRW